MDVKCIECGEAIVFEAEPLPAEIVTCKACGVELEVLGVEPIQLILAPEVEEDWGE